MCNEYTVHSSHRTTDWKHVEDWNYMIYHCKGGYFWCKRVSYDVLNDLLIEREKNTLEKNRWSAKSRLNGCQKWWEKKEGKKTWYKFIPNVFQEVINQGTMIAFSMRQKLCSCFTSEWKKTKRYIAICGGVVKTHDQLIPTPRCCTYKILEKSEGRKSISW